MLGDTKLNFIKKFIIRYIYRPFLIRKYTKWYIKTRNWSKNDWRDWLSEEFEKCKKTKWTRRKYSDLMKYTMEDMVEYPVNEEYEDYPENYPAVITSVSTGTIKKKIVKWTRADLIKNFIAFGRTIWWLKGESRFRNMLLMGGAGVISGEGSKYAIDFISSKGIAKEFESIIQNFDIIKKKEPFDLVFTSLPYLIPFIKKINENIFYNPSFFLITGDRVSPYIRHLVIDLGKRLDSTIYPMDFYGCAEGGILGFEIPTKLQQVDIYVPETHLAFIRKENGELVNILDAKKGDVGEYIITTLQKYVIPNLRLHDVVEVVEENTPLGLPAIRILGRVAHREEIETKSLGLIRGISGLNLRVKGIVFNDYYLTNFIENVFKMKHLILLEEKEDYVIMRVYCDKHIKLEDFLEKLAEDKDTGYLINDYKNDVLRIEVIPDPEVIEEFEKKIFLTRGGQATVPRLILLQE